MSQPRRSFVVRMLRAVLIAVVLVLLLPYLLTPLYHVVNPVSTLMVWRKVTGERVAVLTDMAMPYDQIDEVKVEEARKRAEARLAEKLDDDQTAAVQASLANALAQLNVKRRRQGR